MQLSRAVNRISIKLYDSMSIKVKPSFVVRKLELNDCEQVRDIWAEVKFEGSKYNNEVMSKIDPDGILVAQDIQNGKLLGVCSGINHTSEFAFIGQFAVRPKYQGLGIGSEIWKKVMEHIGTQRNIALYSENHMFEFYHNKCGFSNVPKKIFHVYEGKLNCDQLIKQIDGISVFPINEDNIHDVVQYDKEICDGFDRRVMIEEFSKISDTIALTAIHVITNRVLGYCIMNITNIDTTIVEPLYADNELIAELLITKCSQLLPITRVNKLTFQCWDFNEKAIALAKKMCLDYKYLENESIMFTKQLIEGNLQKIFALSSDMCYPF